MDSFGVPVYDGTWERRLVVHHGTVVIKLTEMVWLRFHTHTHTQKKQIYVIDLHFEWWHARQCLGSAVWTVTMFVVSSDSQLPGMSRSPADVCSRLSSHCISLCPGTDVSDGNVPGNLESHLHQVRGVTKLLSALSLLFSPVIHFFWSCCKAQQVLNSETERMRKREKRERVFNYRLL